MNSRWGAEEQETLEAINRVAFNGNVLNLASGDGRFNNAILKTADVTACDLDEKELMLLLENTPVELRKRLTTVIGNITKLPFPSFSFDGLFCTGTLHLFETTKLRQICHEISRVVKPRGKILFDFACDIERKRSSGEVLIFDGEQGYTEELAREILPKLLNQFNLDISTYTFEESDALTPDGINYSLKGKFLLASGTKAQS